MNVHLPDSGRRTVPRLWQTLLLATLLGGCGSEPVIDQSSLAERQTGTYRQLLLEQDGWRIWRRMRGFRSTCLAVKPAPGRNPPQFNEELSLPSGGVGFYMVIRESWSRPVLGFYGEHPYDRISSAELDGEDILDVDDRDRVLSWEGREVGFRISTLPAPNAHDEALRQTGTLDFTGVTMAHQALLDCHNQPPATLERNFNFGADDD